jgi:hypothetical protein
MLQLENDGDEDAIIISKANIREKGIQVDLKNNRPKFRSKARERFVVHTFLRSHITSFSIVELGTKARMITFRQGLNQINLEDKKD